MKIAPDKRKAMLKRLADFLEKFSIASFAIGVFQNESLGFLFGALCFVLSFVITYWEVPQ